MTHEGCRRPGALRRTVARLAAPIALAVTLAVGSAQAQRCTAELASALDGSTAPDHVSGVEGVAVVRAAVELIEPALPRMRLGDPPGVGRGEPGYDDALWLYERNLLPQAWTPDVFARPIWQEVARRLFAWYGLGPTVVAEPADEASFVADVARVLEIASEAVRPTAIVAFDPADRDRVSFWALMWNWTVFPRLIVVRPAEGVRLEAGVPSILPLLGSCALRPTSFISAAEGTATRLFQANTDAQMVIVGSSPATERRWPYRVGAGDELDVFGFGHPEVADLERYSAVFVGPRVSPLTLLRLLPQVRTNLSPRALLRQLETP